MNLKQLEYFVRVAELGGFTSAAQVLEVAQPALSRQVRQLEVELRQNLFQRHGRGIQVTEDGALMLTRAKEILAHVDQVSKEIGDLKGSPVGRGVVGAPQAVGKSLIVRLVRAFREQFPRASLEIVETNSWLAYERLLSGSIDIALLYDPQHSPQIEIKPLIKQEVLLVSSHKRPLLKPDQKISLKALAELPLILPNYPHKMRSLMESAAARARVKLKIAHQIEGVSFILELVDEGFGCTMLARHLVQESSQPHRFQLNHIGGARLERSLCMAVSSHRKTSPLMQETLHLMTQFIDEDRIADT